MGWFKRLRPSPAMIVATVALVLSLGGTSYAAIVLPANSVGAKQIKRNAVTGAKVKNASLTLADISGASLSKMGRVADADGPNVGVGAMSMASVATVTLTVPKTGFVFVQGWACVNGGGSGQCQVYLTDETAGVPSKYNAVYVAAGQEAGCSVSEVFPASAGERTYTLVVSSAAGATAWGNVSAVFVPYNGEGSSTP